MGTERIFEHAQVVIVCGHYGVGKTNFSLNVAFDAHDRGFEVTLVDLDVVNPYFRSSDYTDVLTARGIRVIAPIFAGTTVEGPSLSGAIAPACDWARQQGPRPRMLVVDVGGDDAGATALGRFAAAVSAGPYEMLYVVNRNRNLTQEPAEAVCVLREIEAQSHLKATAIINNTHLQKDTTIEMAAKSVSYAQSVGDLVGLPVIATTVPADAPELELSNAEQIAVDNPYAIRRLVLLPWE